MVHFDCLFYNKLLTYSSFVESNHIAGGHDQGAKPACTGILEGLKASFCYINLQVTASVGGGQKHAIFFILGALPHCAPAGMCLVESLIVKHGDNQLC